MAVFSPLQRRRNLAVSVAPPPTACIASSGDRERATSVFVSIVAIGAQEGSVMTATKTSGAVGAETLERRL